MNRRGERYLRCGVRIGGGMTCGLPLHHPEPHVLFVNCDCCGRDVLVVTENSDREQAVYCQECETLQ